MKPRQLDLPQLITILIDEHAISMAKLSRIHNHLLSSDFHRASEILDELKKNISQHIVDEEATILRKALDMFGKEGSKDLIEVFKEHRRIFDLFDRLSRTLEECYQDADLFREIRRVLSDHYRKEEDELFPKVLRRYMDKRTR
ncbi:MAG: hemerythrin domain-containing protein [Nitrososphaerota archaeon]